MSTDVVSGDVLWEICRTQSSYLCKRRSGGGVQFSRDPLNLMNKHSRKYEGHVNDKAIGIQSGSNGGVVLMTKKANKAQKPASLLQTTTFSSQTPVRKVYRSIVNTTAKQGYRADLRAEAVARASAIRKSQRPVKNVPEKKLRGKKAKIAAAAKE